MSTGAMCMMCALPWEVDVDEKFQYRLCDELGPNGIEMGMASLLMSRSQFIQDKINLDVTGLTSLKEMNVELKAKPVKVAFLLDLCFQYELRVQSFFFLQLINNYEYP